MEKQRLMANGELVAELARSVHHADADLTNVPLLIKRIIRDDMWQSRWVDNLPLGKKNPVEYDRFVEFVTDSLPMGLAATVDILQRLCHDYPDVQDMIDTAIGDGRSMANNPQGNNQHVKADNVSTRNVIRNERPVGTTRQYALRKLRKESADNPEVRELQSKVLAGEMSPHAAMVEAGFRTKTISIPLDVDRAARVLAKHFGYDWAALDAKVREHL